MKKVFEKKKLLYIPIYSHLTYPDDEVSKQFVILDGFAITVALMNLILCFLSILGDCILTCVRQALSSSHHLLPLAALHELYNLPSSASLCIFLLLYILPFLIFCSFLHSPNSILNYLFNVLPLAVASNSLCPIHAYTL